MEKLDNDPLISSVKNNHEDYILPINSVKLNTITQYNNDTKSKLFNENKIFYCKVSQSKLELVKKFDDIKKHIKTLSLKIINLNEIYGLNVSCFTVDQNDKKINAKSITNDKKQYLDDNLENIFENLKNMDKNITNLIYLEIIINYLPYFKKMSCSSCCCCCRSTEEDRYPQTISMYYQLNNKVKENLDLINGFVKLILDSCNVACFKYIPELAGNNTTKNKVSESFSLSHLLVSENTLTFPINKRRLLVYINPAGGQGKAVKTWDSVKGLFINNNGFIEMEVFYTKYAKHAYVNTLEIKDKNKYQGILCCSGDGIIHEVINALIKKKTQEGFEDLDIPVGALPSGTSNALAKVIGVENKEAVATPKTMAYIIIRGLTRYIDLQEIEFLNTSEKVYSFLSINYAFIADIDLESEL